MTHPAAVVQRALELRQRGRLSREIADELSIPAGTIRHWVAGHVPVLDPRGGPGCRRIFTDACDLIGVRWTIARTHIYVSRTADVATLDSFIGPKA